VEAADISQAESEPDKPESNEPGSSRSSASTAWQYFVNWLYLPNTHINWTRRLTGFAALPILTVVWFWSHGGRGPANIPAWRFGPHMLVLPMPPEYISQLAVMMAGIAGLCMLVGLRHKIWPLTIAIYMGYFGSSDWVACGCHFIVLEWINLVALLFERAERSATRRIIQVSTIICYLYTGWQKLLFPGFRDGYSFEATFADGWGLNDYWHKLLPLSHLGHNFWVIVSWATIVGEICLGLGLLFPKTRKATAIFAIVFHLAIAVLLDRFIVMFSLVMWAGLTTFFDKKVGKAQNKTQSKSQSFLDFSSFPTTLLTSKINLQAALAAVFLAVLIFFPLRVYFYPGRPVDRLAFFDRSPWSFCMFVARQETIRLDAKYQDPQGQWHEHKIGKDDRWGGVSSDSETYALAAYMFRIHPEAKRVRIETDILLNGLLPQESVLERERNDSSKEVSVHFSPPKPEMQLNLTHFRGL
jgi:hypothetical protein